jgi:hypothetical protein
MTGEASGGETAKDPGIYLQERIDYWEFELMRAGPLAIDEIAVEALDELNFLWPHDDESFAFEGRGWFPVAGESEEPDLVDDIWSSMGVSQGFTIEDVEETGDYRLYHQFLIGRSVEQASLAKRTTTEHFAYMCTDTSLVLNEELENAVTDRADPGVQEIDPGEYSQGVADASLELMAMLDSVAFQRQAPNRQRREVRRFIKGCEQQFDLRNLGAILEAEHCFRPVPITDAKSQHRLYERVSIEESMVTGVLVGYDAIEHDGLVPGRRRKNKEVFYRDAGLCLILAVKQATESVLKPEDVILVPTGNQSIGISYTTMLSLPDIEDIQGPGGDGPDGLVGA